MNKTYQQIRDAVGLDIAINLWKGFGGTYLYVPASPVQAVT